MKKTTTPDNESSVEKPCNKANCVSFNSKENCSYCETSSKFAATPPKEKTKEPDVEYKEYFMIHEGHITSKRSKSIKIYDSLIKANEDAMKLALDNPGKKYYVLNTVAVFQNKVEKAYLDFREAGNLK